MYGAGINDREIPDCGTGTCPDAPTSRMRTTETVSRASSGRLPGLRHDEDIRVVTPATDDEDAAVCQPGGCVLGACFCHRPGGQESNGPGGSVTDHIRRPTHRRRS